jgi:iron(III) transport system substrate-binding protein
LIRCREGRGKSSSSTPRISPEVEQQVIKAFNKRFPEIKVEMVRAPGGS